MPPRHRRLSSANRFTMWVQQHRRAIRSVLKVAGIGLLVLTALQLVWPAGRILPFVKVAGQPVGAQTAASAAKQLEPLYKDASIEVKTDDKSFKRPLAEVGIDPEIAATTRSAAKYPLLARFVPLSSVFIMAFRDTPMQARYDEDRVGYFAQQVSKDGYVPPTNASVRVKGDRATLVPAKPSKTYSKEEVLKSLKDTHPLPATIIVLKPKTKDAERTDKEVKAVLEDAQKAVDRPLVLDLEGEKITVPKATVGEWLDFPEDAKTKQLTLSLKSDKVEEYLKSVQSKVYVAPGKTVVRIVDGREVSRENGKAGKGIDMPKAVSLLKTAVQEGERDPVAVPLAKLEPTVSYDRQYSNSDKGLAALLSDLASSKGGYGIAVMEIGGRSGTANGNKRFIAASTYKLYVAYAVLKKIEAGQMSWADVIYNGQNAETCFEIMITKSDNPCAKAFGSKIGWRTVEDMVRAVGVSSNTSLTGADLYTTASDLALFLYKLENGSLVSGADRTRLLDLMKRQIYRAAIPAGTGVAVANKPGFLDALIHDAGIVYGPKGAYVMVLMTNGSSWSQMADAAHQIHNYLN